MLETLISSKTRIKLLLKFFLNHASRSYLRGLESEFGESSNAIRLELNRFEKAGMLNSEKEGNRKYFKANPQHPLFDEIQGLMRKYVGIDEIVDQVVTKLGNLERVFLEGKLAYGLEAEVIDLVLIGKHIDRQYLTELIVKAEKVIKKPIRYVLLEPKKEQDYIGTKPEKPFLIWSR